MKQRKVHLDGVLAVLLLGVFAACVLAVLLAGADGYQRRRKRSGSLCPADSRAVSGNPDRQADTRRGNNGGTVWLRWTGRIAAV